MDYAALFNRRIPLLKIAFSRFDQSQPAFQAFLKEGEYTPKEIKSNTLKEAVGFAYWGITVAIYLFWSFYGNGWYISWLIFIIAGVLFPLVMKLCDSFSKKN